MWHHDASAAEKSADKIKIAEDENRKISKRQGNKKRWTTSKAVTRVRTDTLHRTCVWRGDHRNEHVHPKLRPAFLSLTRSPIPESTAKFFYFRFRPLYALRFFVSLAVPPPPTLLLLSLLSISLKHGERGEVANEQPRKKGAIPNGCSACMCVRARGARMSPCTHSCEHMHADPHLCKCGEGKPVEHRCTSAPSDAHVHTHVRTAADAHT